MVAGFFKPPTLNSPCGHPSRLWISGIKAVQRRLGLNRVIDLSATPFFLHGSGCAEGTLFLGT